MGSTQFGNFQNLCRDSTLPICNLFVNNNQPPGLEYNGCVLRGIPLGNNRYLANVGSIILAAFAVIITIFLLLRTQRKAAAVGRREIQLFLIGYIVISICEIFTVGGIPGLTMNVRQIFTALHIAAIIGTAWILFMNSLVGYQLLDDGTAISVGLILGSAAALAIGTGYIALDTSMGWTDYWQDSRDPPYRAIALYVLYQIAPLLFIVLFFILETILVLRVLGETKPMIYLVAAAVLFAIGQVFNYVVSVHICDPTNGKIDGALFQTLFTLMSVIMVWVFWSSITEDDWPVV